MHERCSDIIINAVELPAVRVVRRQRLEIGGLHLDDLQVESLHRQKRRGEHPQVERHLS